MRGNQVGIRERGTKEGYIKGREKGGKRGPNRDTIKGRVSGAWDLGLGASRQGENSLLDDY